MDEVFAALGHLPAVSMQGLLDTEPNPSPPATEQVPRRLTKEQADAFVVDGGTTTGGLLSMRCSTCREVKGVSSFPPSCATWRRGACRSCRRQAAKDKPLVAKKLESARHRFGSVRSVTLHDIERLIQDAGLDTSNDLKRYCLSKRDAALPFTADNAMWVTARRLASS
jgi:hypothetical protein